MNETCRTNNIVFVLACNHGVATSIFSDFGPRHEITDALGEPTRLLAVSNLEVLPTCPELLKIQGVTPGKEPVVIVTIAQADHGLDDGDIVQLDDMRGALQAWNGRRMTVKRVAFVSPTAAKVNAQDVTFTEILKQSTTAVVENFTKQLDFYQVQHEKSGDSNKKLPVRTITMFNRLALVVDDEAQNALSAEGVTNLTDLGTAYHAGGLLQQVRPPIYKEYESLSATLHQGTAVPQMLRGEDWESGAGIENHLCVAAVPIFYEKFHRFPGVHSQEDANFFLEIVRDLSKERQKAAAGCWAQTVSFGFPMGQPRDLDEIRVKRFARLFGTELTGLCAFLGGATAQEVLKKTGKFTPISQWIHHEEACLVHDEEDDSGNNSDISNVSPLFGSRYDHQIAIMGKDFQAKLANQRIFLVGCGALGCEYLKGLSLMGAGTGRHGHIYVTDMDRIEVSNLSRQFLFRDKDVGSPKSVSGARVVKEWNPQLNITALEKKVGPDTEDFFDDSFWESLDLCWNALDNVIARKYTDAQCLLHSKPLLESGTLGTKCNHEVILPFRTSTYNDGKESDENENQIAMCTLRSFPYLPLHCIEFAKQAYFSDYFEFGPDQYETFRKDMASFFEQLDAMEPGEQLKSLKTIQSYISLQKENNGRMDFAACVRTAFDILMRDFRTSVLNLCYSADAMEKSSGTKFWTGTKRRPRPVEWTNPMPELWEYLYCTANMYAVVWGLEPVRDRVAFEKIVTDMDLKQPEWTPPSENINLNDNDDDDTGGGDASAEAEKLKAELYNVDPSTLPPAYAHDFEKDDDSNFHIDFLTVATNLRAWNYDIKSSPRHTVKVTAGRIIPALATTTAMVCGLVDIEFCKLVLGLESQGRGKFLNSNINLAAGSGNFTTFSPDPPVALKTGLDKPKSFTSWDQIVLAFGSDNEMSVEQLVQYIQSAFGVTVDRIFAHGNTSDTAIYSAVDKQKLTWDIRIDEEGKPHVSDGVFTQWPQIRMAVQMLGRLPPTSGQRKVFEGQINNVKKALDGTKKSFRQTFTGSVSHAYRTVYRPTNDQLEKQEYFDRVYDKRDYVLLGVHCRTAESADIHLPCINYIVTAPEGETSEQSMKRMRVEEN
jgi:ubiquitin-activating enzyme E1